MMGTGARGTGGWLSQGLGGEGPGPGLGWSAGGHGMPGCKAGCAGWEGSGRRAGWCLGGSWHDPPSTSGPPRDLHAALVHSFCPAHLPPRHPGHPRSGGRHRKWPGCLASGGGRLGPQSPGCGGCWAVVGRMRDRQGRGVARQNLPSCPAALPPGVAWGPGWGRGRPSDPLPCQPRGDTEATESSTTGLARSWWGRGEASWPRVCVGSIPGQEDPSTACRDRGQAREECLAEGPEPSVFLDILAEPDSGPAGTT